MNKQKLMSILTWIVTVITVIMWLPVLMIPIVLLISYMPLYNKASVGIIGGEDGPTAIYPTSTNSVAFAFIGGISDFIVLGVLLVLTIVLWHTKIKLGKK